MKREELQPTEIYARFASEVYDDFGDVSSKQEYYRKEHADSVMDAMEAKIKELKNKNRNLLYSSDMWMACCKLMSEGKRNVMSSDALAEMNRIAELEAENARLKCFCDRLVKDCKWLHTDRTPDKHGFETMVLCTNGKKRVAEFRMFDLRWYDVNNGDRLNVVKWLWQPKMPTTEESSATEKENG